MTRRPEVKRSVYAAPSHPLGDTDPNVDLTNVNDQRGMILSILCDFLEDDRIADFSDWIDHVGFDLTALRYPSDLAAAWLAHYRRGRGYDVDRALNDLLTWPPIAAHIAHWSEQPKRKVSASRGPGKQRSGQPSD